MANGMDPMSRREFFARRVADVGIVSLVLVAGPVFGRMLNSLYVQEAGRDTRAPADSPNRMNRESQAAKSTKL